MALKPHCCHSDTNQCGEPFLPPRNHSELFFSPFRNPPEKSAALRSHSFSSSIPRRSWAFVLLPSKSGSGCWISSGGLAFRRSCANFLTKESLALGTYSGRQWDWADCMGVVAPRFYFASGK